MKENMQKVPLVQEMSEKYHRKEIEHAESLLDTIDYSKEEKTIKVLKKEEPVGFFQKIKNYLFG